MNERAKLAAKTSETKKENSTSRTKKTNSSPSISSPVDQILSLQRTVGNQAVQGLIKSGVIQAKLTIGQPGDIYEREADRVAEQVMRMPDLSRAQRKGVSKDNKLPSIQRMCTECEEELQRPPMDEEEELLQAKEVSGSTPEINSATQSQINSIRGGGQPLPESIRAFFEPRFGQDSSQVRIHTGSNAGESAKAVNALAYTIGQDVVFSEGQYSPGTESGKKLIAHELTHVVQQSGSNGNSFGQNNEKGGQFSISQHSIEGRAVAGSVQRQPAPPTEIEMPVEWAFAADERKRTWRHYARSLGKKDAVRIRKSGKLTSEDREEVNAKLRFFEGDAMGAYIEEIKPALVEVTREEIEMPAEYIGTVDTPADVLEAIVNIMSASDYFGDITALGEMHPLYYIQVRKNVTKKEYVDLLWWWFQITNEKVTDKRGIQTIVQGSMARTHITRAVAETAPLVKAVEAAGSVNPRLVTRYKAKIEEFTQRAAREEVTEMVEAGVEKERVTRAKPGAMTEEEMAKAGAVKAAATLDELAAVARRLTVKFGTSQLKETFDKQMHDWVKTFTLKTSPFIPEPVAPAMKMNFADGITWLKGGLDAATAILTVTDPAARKKLFEARAGYFGKMAQGLEINRLLWQFVSGTIAISGAGVYGIARVRGNTKLAADVLEVSTRWVGNVAGPLFLVGVFHGAAVLLDPEASANEKAEAAVEVASSAVGVAGFASRWTPRLAGAARWSGPIAASLTINFYQFKYLADKAAAARIGLSRLDWVPCAKATKAAAEEVQQWAVRLAVTNALMVHEADAPRLRELRKSADAFREELVERQLKPYVESKTRLGSTNQDPDDCGPALTDRFKPLLPLLAPGVKNDDAALQVAATFLNIVSTAFTEWDKIVMAKPR